MGWDSIIPFLLDAKLSHRFFLLVFGDSLLASVE